MSDTYEETALIRERARLSLVLSEIDAVTLENQDLREQIEGLQRERKEWWRKQEELEGYLHQRNADHDKTRARVDILRQKLESLQKNHLNESCGWESDDN